MSELPNGWLALKLGDVVDYALNTTVQPEAMQPDTWLLELEDIERDSSRLLSHATVEDRKPQSAKNSFQAGDVLYGKLRPYLNKVIRAERDGHCSSEIIPIKPQQLDRGFLFHYLKSPYFLKYVRAVTHGVRMPRLGTDQAKAAPFPLPPLAEQKRIAQKLDALLAQVDTLKARIDAIPALLKRFRQHTRSAAVSGRLTEKWRSHGIATEVPAVPTKVENLFEVPEGWAWQNFEHVSTADKHALKAGPFGSALKKADCVAVGIKVYGQEQVISGDETIQTYRINEAKFKELQACRTGPGDLLISLVGTIGKVLVLSDGAEHGIINPRLVKISLSKEINRTYIKHYLESAVSHEFFKRFSHGGTMEILNLGILKRLPLPIPPPAEQAEIVRRVEQLFAFADQLEARVSTAQKRIDALTQSLLAKAFRGELVPQDPNDEPASVLLERIRAQRAAAPRPRRGRKAAAN